MRQPLIAFSFVLAFAVAYFGPQLLAQDTAADATSIAMTADAAMEAESTSANPINMPPVILLVL
ncbi:MAG: hypothetical protein AB8B91_24785 [Rubripirellula sp.]